MLVPLKMSTALFDIYIAPPTPNALPPYVLFSFAELTLSKKLLVPVKCSELAYFRTAEVCAAMGILKKSKCQLAVESSNTTS